jgi:hypothetical protein
MGVTHSKPGSAIFFKGDQNRFLEAKESRLSSTEITEISEHLRDLCFPVVLLFGQPLR